MSNYGEYDSGVDTDRSTEQKDPLETIGRRTLLAGAAALAAALTAGCSSTDGSGGGAVRTPGGLAPLAVGDVPGRWSANPDGLDAEPMDTQLGEIDGAAVLYQYGAPVPSFDTWSGNGDRRGYRSLDGRWRFRFDPEDRGIGAGWYGSEFDDDDWRAVTVPLPWDLYDTPGFGTYDGGRYGSGTAFRNGLAWYRTRFTAPERSGGRLFRLNFLGAYYMAWVFVNGRFVGQHEGGNTPFSLDVSDVVRPGEENTLAVRVFRRPWWRDDVPFRVPIVDDTEVPGRPVDYWPYAGLTRSVYLESIPEVTVSKLLVDARAGMLSVRAVVENRGEDPVRRRLILDPGEGTGGEPRSLPIEIGPGGVRVPTARLDVPDAAAWSPRSPTCYRLTAELVGGDGPGDVLSTRYGVRTLAADGSRLTLSGVPVFLKGVNWHEETPQRGRSLSDADYDDLVARLDDLDGNLLRNSHYTRHPYLYRAADEAGVLVLDEAANMWLDGDQQRVQLHSYGLSRALVAAMVWNQHNHPSVGLWSLHNECDFGSPAYRDWVADMRSVATALDTQDRPVTWAARSSRDPAFDLADVIGFNEYYGYFEGRDEDLGPRLDGLHRAYPDRPLLITENGSWSAPELRGTPGNSRETPGTPEWQAAKFEAHWDQVTDEARLRFVAGYTYWNLRDYKQRYAYNRDSYNAISTMGLLPFGGEHETLAYEAFRDAVNPLDDRPERGR